MLSIVKFKWLKYPYNRLFFTELINLTMIDFILNNVRIFAKHVLIEESAIISNSCRDNIRHFIKFQKQNYSKIARPFHKKRYVVPETAV